MQSAFGRQNPIKEHCWCYVVSGMSASRVGGSLMPDWATRAGKVPHHVSSMKFLERQKFCTSNAVWDLTCPGSPNRCQTTPNPRSWQAFVVLNRKLALWSGLTWWYWGKLIFYILTLKMLNDISNKYTHDAKADFSSILFYYFGAIESF